MFLMLYMKLICVSLDIVQLHFWDIFRP